METKFLYNKLPFFMCNKGYDVHYDHENVTIHNAPIESILLQGTIKRVRLHHDYLMQATTTQNGWDIANKGDVVTFYIYKTYTTKEISVVVHSINNVTHEDKFYFKDVAHLQSFIQLDDASLELLIKHNVVVLPTEILCRGCAAYSGCKLEKKGTVTKCKNHWQHRPTSDFTKNLK